MRGKLKSIIIFFVASCSGCSFEYKHIKHEYNAVWELKKTGEKEFDLDEDIPGEWARVAVARIHDTCFFIAYNVYNAELLFYDYYSTLLTRKRKLDVEANGFYIIKDTLYCYNYERCELHVMTLEVEIVETIRFPVKD